MTSAYHSAPTESCAYSVRNRQTVEELLLGSITERGSAPEQAGGRSELGPDVLERLKLLIARLGTHQEAAEKTGIPYATLQRMLYGTSRLAAERLHRISGALAVPAERLIAYLFQAEAPPAVPDLSSIIASAQAFRVAIDALQVRRKIRNRLLAHLDAHVAAIHALGANAPEAGQ